MVNYFDKYSTGSIFLSSCSKQDGFISFSRSPGRNVSAGSPIFAFSTLWAEEIRNGTGPTSRPKPIGFDCFI
jgi:hypothetical protein